MSSESRDGEGWDERLLLAARRSLDAAFYRFRPRPAALAGASGGPAADWFEHLPPTTPEDIGAAGQPFWRVAPGQAAELIETAGGALFPLTRADLDVFADGARASLGGLVGEGTLVALYLSLGEMSLLPLALYRACIAAGATTLRHGAANIARQQWLSRRYPAAVACATPAVWRHIQPVAAAGTVPAVGAMGAAGGGPRWVACAMPAPGRSGGGGDTWDGATRVAMSHPLVPAILVQEEDGAFRCPGYYCEVLAASGRPAGRGCPGELALTTVDVEGFSLLRFRTGLAATVAGEGRDSRRVTLSGRGAAAGPASGADPLRERVLRAMGRCRAAAGLKPDGGLELDSVGVVELLVALEEEFSFRTDVEEIDRAAFASLDTVSRFVAGKLGAAGAVGGGDAP